MKEYVVDKTRPIAHAFMAYPIEGKGVFADRSKSSLMVLHLLRCRVYLQLGERSDLVYGRMITWKGVMEYLESGIPG